MNGDSVIKTSSVLTALTMSSILNICFIAFFIITVNAKIHKFLSVKCDFSGSNVEVELCEISPNGTLELTFHLNKKLTEVFVRILTNNKTQLFSTFFLQITITSKVRSGNIYKRLYQTPTFEYCAFRRGTALNPLFTVLIDQTKSSTIIFRDCPIQPGKIEVTNGDVKDDSFYGIYPSGNYQGLAVVSNRNKTNVLTLTIDYSITSANKFG